MHTWNTKNEKQAMSWCLKNKIRLFAVPQNDFYVDKAKIDGKFRKRSLPYVKIAIEINGVVVRVGDMQFKQSDPKMNDKMQEIYQYYYERNIS